VETIVRMCHIMSDAEKDDIYQWVIDESIQRIAVDYLDGYVVITY
jgi:hypothetical protein